MKRRNSIKLALQRGASRAVILGPLTFLLVAGAGCPSLFEGPTHRSAKIRQALPGKDGEKTVTTVTDPAGAMVNGYATLDDDVLANATTVTFSNADATFNTLEKGDLLLIIQMQGATISTTDTVGYGAVTNLGGAGLYEFVGVEAVEAGTITVACPLKHAYTLAGKTQLIRVPQYTILTIGSGASIIPQLWNGTRGGIVAVHATTVNLNGSIDASAKGFRGGPKHDTDGTTVGPVPYATDSQTGAEKGESIAGYQADYGTNTRYGRGAPANGGGGGDEHNGGGGGGANAGLVSGWTNGRGVASGWTNGTTFNACSDANLPTSAGPWALDPDFTTCAAWSYQGGGRGGYSWSDNPGNALTVAPGDSAWGGDRRRNTGGLGGRPLDSGAATRLFMGGGGGAGDGNDDNAGPGGIGGGMVFIIAGTVDGSGSVLANGGPGGDDESGGNGDAAGGGGGGGTIVINAASLASTVQIRANGGSGGRHRYSSGDNEVEGPGGGGGGGYIAVSGGTPTVREANGGVAGQTTIANSALSEFRENGATAGHAGIANASASGLLYCGVLLVTTIETAPDNPTNDNTGDFTFSNTSTGVSYECKLDDNDYVDCDAIYATPPLDDGTHTLTVRATDANGNVEADPPSHTWVVDTVPPVTTIVTQPDNPTDNPVGTFTFGVTGETGPVTYECNLDDAGFVPCTPTFTTPALGSGPHTLEVQATDAAGNTDTTPATYTWTINALSLDGGVLDAGESEAGEIDVGPVDLGPIDVGSADDGPLVLLDGGAVDAEAIDVPIGLDVRRDSPAPVVDTGEGLDGPADRPADVALETGPATEVGRDTQPTGAEPSPDTAPVAEPAPDSAAPSTNDDTAAPTVNEDAPTAPPTPTPVEYLGGGFCALSASHTASPLGFALLALAGLALLRRRRQ